MSKKYIKLEPLYSCEQLAVMCRDNWEYEEVCPVGDLFRCPFFGAVKKCSDVTTEMWEALCTQGEDE